MQHIWLSLNLKNYVEKTNTIADVLSIIVELFFRGILVNDFMNEPIDKHQDAEIFC